MRTSKSLLTGVFTGLLLLGSNVALAQSDIAASYQSSPESVQRGRQLFLAHCTQCHGENGKAEASPMADATDLTAPDRWLNGTRKEDVFVSINAGAGIDMPPFGFTLEDEQDVVDLANYVMSLWPKAQ